MKSFAVPLFFMNKNTSILIKSIYIWISFWSGTNSAKQKKKKKKRNFHSLNSLKWKWISDFYGKWMIRPPKDSILQKLLVGWFYGMSILVGLFNTFIPWMDILCYQLIFHSFSVIPTLLKTLNKEKKLSFWQWMI